MGKGIGNFVVLAGLLTALCHGAAAQSYDYSLSIGVGRSDLSAGTALYKVEKARWNGADAMHISLSMTTGDRASKVIMLADTIDSWNTPDGESLFYSKLVNEGRKHNLEHAVFKSENGAFIAEMTTWNNRTGQQTGHGMGQRDTRIYDLLSMLEYARANRTTILSRQWSVGQTMLTVPMVNGTLVVDQLLVYEGKTQIPSADGQPHPCIQISVQDRKLGKLRETMKIFVTDNAQCIPILIQLQLTSGISLRARLSE